MGVRRGEHQDINESLYVGPIHLSTALVSWARERERFLTLFWWGQAHRREVLDILTSFIPRDRVQFNKRLTDIEQREDHVVLSFADGIVAKAALVVGADGIQSIVREHVLRSIDPEGIAPKYANSYAYRAVIPMADAKEILGDRLTDTAKMYLGKDRLVVTYRVSGGAVSDFVVPARMGELS